MPTITLYKWRVRDPISGRMFTTRWLATEEDIRKRYLDAVAVEWTREEREIVEPERLAAGHVQRAAPTRRD